MAPGGHVFNGGGSLSRGLLVRFSADKKRKDLELIAKGKGSREALEA